MFKTINSKIKFLGKVVLQSTGEPPTGEPPTGEPPTGEPPTENPAYEAAYQLWLAENTGVNQYTGDGTRNGQWAYDQTGYGSEADALAAQEADYQTWLAANTGVNQYTGNGIRNGQWAYNQTEYASEADALADEWGATNDGQYESSGKWYLDGAYVGSDESSYNTAVNNAALAAETDGQYNTTGRWYYNGVYLEDGENAYNNYAANQWGLTNDGQYESSGRWYLNGSLVSNANGPATESEWIDLVNNYAGSASTTGEYGSTGRYYVNGLYATCYNAPTQAEIDTALDAWKLTVDDTVSGQVYYTRNSVTCEFSFTMSQSVNQEPSTDRFIHENAIYNSQEAYDTAVAADDVVCTEPTPEEVASAAQTWAATASNDGEFKYSLNASCEVVYNGSGTGSGKYAFEGTLYNSEGEYNSAVASAAMQIADANTWGTTSVGGVYPSGQYLSSGRYYHGGTYIGNQAQYDSYIANLPTEPEDPTTSAEDPTTSAEDPTTSAEDVITTSLNSTYSDANGNDTMHVYNLLTNGVITGWYILRNNTGIPVLEGTNEYTGQQA